MDANAREVWKARHRVSLRMRRQQRDAVNVHANQRAAAEASSFRTVWDAGNTEYPLRQELLRVCGALTF